MCRAMQVNETRITLQERNFPTEHRESKHTELPRNLKQLQNLRVNFLSQNRISKGELYNLHEIAFDTNDFVRNITRFSVCMWFERSA